MTDGYIEKRTLMQDLARSGIDFKTREKMRSLIEVQKGVNLLERDDGKEPLLETKNGYSHVSYADGTGEFQVNEYTDWVCPTCGWFVGELYSGFGEWHIQGDLSYCARCGQKIDWSLPKDDEKRRYEERKERERKERMEKEGVRLDNMHRHLREKYGMMGDSDGSNN